MDIDRLEVELDLLTRIKPGDTVDIDTMEILPRNSWNRWWSGWYRGECRTKTIIFVEGITEKVVVYNKRLSLNLIEMASKGILNLEITYGTDMLALDRLRASRLKLDKLWCQTKKTTPLFIPKNIPTNSNVHEYYAGQSSSFPSYNVN